MKKMGTTKMTRMLNGQHPADVRFAARLIKQGHLVAIPTETVYGLAALSTHENYIKGIYEAKNRPNTNPLILHVHSLEQALDLWQLSSAQGETIKNWIQTLANHFWPGPLTLVAPKAHTHPQTNYGWPRHGGRKVSCAPRCTRTSRRTRYATRSAQRQPVQ